INCVRPRATGRRSMRISRVIQRGLLALLPVLVGTDPGSSPMALQRPGFGAGPSADAHVPASLLVTTTADSGAGSLRQVLRDAVDGDTIAFDPPTEVPN